MVERAEATSLSSPAVPGPGLTLCLSGGGFRATLFHLGCVLRLNELGVLGRLSTITSVSGGSILNGVLATRWSDLRDDGSGTYANMDEVVAKPVESFCATDLRTPLLIGSRLNLLNLPIILRDWGAVPASLLAKAYDSFFKSTLREISAPTAKMPRFVFCATNLQTGLCWHFHSGPEARMGDFHAGYCSAGHVRVSEAVAASSSFPPGFSALRLRIPRDCKVSRVDPWGVERPESAKREKLPEPALRTALLTDGGVYDNLGVEPVWNRVNSILVSNAGLPFSSVPRINQSIVGRLRRASEISMTQVGAVRLRWLVSEFQAGKKSGAVWALDTLLDDFGLKDAQGYGAKCRNFIKGVRTDLDAFTEAEMSCLINHGYSLADAALRSRALAICPKPNAPFCWPRPNWCDETEIPKYLKDSHRRKIFRDALRYLSPWPAK